jgi:hypothetical protein
LPGPQTGGLCLKKALSWTRLSADKVALAGRTDQSGGENAAITHDFEIIEAQ